MTYTAWPAPTDVTRRLISASLTLKGVEPQRRIVETLNEVAAEVAQFTKRQFLADAMDTVRVYDGTGTPEIEVDEIVSLTGVALVGIQTAPGYTLSGVILVQEQGRPQTRLVVARGSIPAFVSEGVIVPYPSLFPAGRQNVQVTGQFGYAASIPADLWGAVCGEVAHRLAGEAVFDPTGRLKQWKEGDESETRELSASPDTWHGAFCAAVKRYARPTGRKLRNMRPRMV